MPDTLPSPHKGMGANVHPGGTSFRVWAPNARNVFVSFAPNWARADHPMAREPDDGAYWSVDIPGVAAGAEYQFVIENKNGKPASENGDNWRAHAQSRDVNDEDRHDVSSCVVDPATDWGGQWSAFGTPRFDDLILYQVHVGSFSGLNDGIDVHDPTGHETATFDQFAHKLDYIRGLGFNALALLPLSEFRGMAGMGYAPTNQFAPETAYGTPARLRALIDLAHRKGFAVIFDVVYNHGASEGNRLWNYDGEDSDGGIYFENGGDSDFGHRFAHWNEDVRKFFFDNAQMWLGEYRGDGLRFDVAHGIARESLKFIIDGVRRNEFWRDKLLIAEWDGDQRDKWNDVVHGIGFDAVWEMDSWFAFERAVHRNDPVGNAKRMVSLGFGHHWNRVVYLLGSHDNIRDGDNGNAKGQPRFPVQKLGGRDNWHARAQCRMGWALTAAAPGIPMLFMGCEGHHHGYWWPNRDGNPGHQDHRIDWSIMGDWAGAPMQRLVRGANAARWANPALRTTTLDWTHEDRDNGVVAFRRWNDQGNVVLVVANFSDRRWQHHDYGLSTKAAGRWEEVFNSQSPEYGGYDNSGNFGHTPWTQGDGKIYINLPQWSVLMFRKAE